MYKVEKTITNIPSNRPLYIIGTDECEHEDKSIYLEFYIIPIIAFTVVSISHVYDTHVEVDNTETSAIHTASDWLQILSPENKAIFDKELNEIIINGVNYTIDEWIKLEENDAKVRGLEIYQESKDKLYRLLKTK